MIACLWVADTEGSTGIENGLIIMRTLTRLVRLGPMTIKLIFSATKEERGGDDMQSF